MFWGIFFSFLIVVVGVVVVVERLIQYGDNIQASLLGGSVKLVYTSECPL